jgi:allantoinase
MSNPRIPFRLSSEQPRLPPLQGKRLLVHVVVNVEHWPLDQPMPRSILPAPHGREAVPDVPNFSWAEYGMRCGLPRFLRTLGDRGIPASVAINAVCLEQYPSAAEAMRDAGWEFMGHGVHQQAMNVVDDPAGVVTESLARLEAFTGHRPRGWLGPGLRESADTPELLVAGGVEYVCDWTVDDVPVWMHTANGPLIAMPYSLELNDSVVHAVEDHPSSAVYDRVRDTVETFERELDETPRVLTIPLHPHLMGVPHRIGYLGKALDLLAAREDTAFVTGSQLADWFTAAQPTPGS